MGAEGPALWVGIKDKFRLMRREQPHGCGVLTWEDTTGGVGVGWAEEEGTEVR